MPRVATTIRAGRRDWPVPPGPRMDALLLGLDLTDPLLRITPGCWSSYDEERSHLVVGFGPDDVIAEVIHELGHKWLRDRPQILEDPAAQEAVARRVRFLRSASSSRRGGGVRLGWPSRGGRQGGGQGPCGDPTGDRRLEGQVNEGTRGGALLGDVGLGAQSG
jgi:hypothetical protein